MLSYLFHLRDGVSSLDASVEDADNRGSKLLQWCGVMRPYLVYNQVQGEQRSGRWTESQSKDFKT